MTRYQQVGGGGAAACGRVHGSFAVKCRSMVDEANTHLPHLPEKRVVDLPLEFPDANGRGVR